MPHWGKEYSLKTNKYHNKWSKIFFELGVDIVIGTHPHVIQPVEIIEDEDKNRKMYIFYSLRNFINLLSSPEIIHTPRYVTTLSGGVGSVILAQRVNSNSSRKKIVFWRFLGGMAHIIIGKVNNKPAIKNIKFIRLITHIIPENKKVATFKVKDYSENMAKNNYVGIEYDKTFTYDNMIDVFRNAIDKDFLDFNL